MVELSRFPLEVLCNVTGNLLASEVFSLLYLSGDRLLATKLIQGGVRYIHFDTPACLNIGFKFLADFKGLVAVSIDYSDVKVLNLDDIPDTIRDLRVKAMASIWLQMPASPSLSNDPKYRLLICDGLAPYDFRRFKNLKILYLKTTTSRWLDWRRDCLIARLLPATLERFSISGLAYTQPIYFKNLPSGLKIDFIDESASGEWISEVIKCAPQIHFDHLIAHSFDPILAAAPAHTLSIVIHDLALHDLPRFAVLFPQTGFPTANSATTTSDKRPPYLVSIRAREWSWDPHKDKELKNMKWPESLHTIEDGSNNGRNLPLEGNMPPHLTRLEYRLDGNAPLTIPETVTSLKLRPHLQRPLEQDILTLPRSLTTLSIGRGVTWLHRFSSLLPGSLKHLALDCMMSPLNDEFFTNLPPVIETIMVDTECNDKLLAHLPKSVKKFEPRSLYLTGAIPLLNNSDKLTISSIGFLNCFPSDKLSFSIVESSKGSTRHLSTLAFDGVPLPSNLTHLQIHFNLSNKSFKEPIYLPHLTRLDLKAMDRWNWESSTMPSLTRLHIATESKVKTISCPPSITHLVLKGPETRPGDMHIPNSLLRTLRILETSSLPNAPTLLKLRSLQTFSLTSYLPEHHPEVAFPPSLTSLSFPNHAPTLGSLQDAMGKLPLLRHLNIHHVYKHISIASLPAECLETFTCSHLQVDDLEPYLNPELGTIEGDTLNLADFTTQRLQKISPFLKLSQPQWIAATVTHSSMRALSSLWTSNLTTITFGSGITLWSRFGKLLPPTLTSLDVLRASGITNATPWHLPSSITDLKIHTGTFPSCAYQSLPRGLISLQFETQALLNRHVQALPPNLQKLNLKTRIIGLKALTHLPSSITHLQFDCNRVMFEDIFVQGLPRKLQVLRVTSYIGAPLNFEPYPDLVDIPAPAESPTRARLLDD